MIRVAIYFADSSGVKNISESRFQYNDCKLTHFHKVLEAPFDYEDKTDSQICELIYMKTNKESGEEQLQLNSKKIIKNNLHDSLSLGDIILIKRPDGNKVFLCVNRGWENLEPKKNIGRPQKQRN